jgi:hypothetical protein
MSVVRQYKLALKLAQAVLQFQSMPWLEEEWNLQQLLVMPETDDTCDDLHVYKNSKLITMGPRAMAPSIPTIIPQGSSKPIRNPAMMPLSMAQHRGVDNLTLFCLGIAMIEIAYWKPIANLREDYDNDNIDTARRLANGSTGLGKRYDETIRKCLRCDFAFGVDLNRIELQSAVYGGVICPLQDLIERLDGLSI